MGAPEPMQMGEPEMNEPMLGGEEGPENEPEIPDNEPKGENSEIDDIFSKLDTEKQAAVIKYAKSMVNNNADDSSEEDEMVTEIANNILDDEKKKPEDGEDEKIRNKKVTTANPFVAKTFKK